MLHAIMWTYRFHYKTYDFIKITVGSSLENICEIKEMARIYQVRLFISAKVSGTSVGTCATRMRKRESPALRKLIL